MNSRIIKVQEIIPVFSFLKDQLYWVKIFIKNYDVKISLEDNLYFIIIGEKFTIMSR